FKLEKRHLDRRLEQLKAEGVEFKTGAHIGVDVDSAQLRKDFDALALCGGATWSRGLSIPGRELKGVHFAMEFLPQANRIQMGETVRDQIMATGKDVVILGGGDTGADCLGTAHRQHPKSVKQFEILARPPEKRAGDNPWPNYDRIFRTASAHEEGGERDFGIDTLEFLGANGAVRALKCIRVEWEPQPGGPPKLRRVAGSEFEIPAQLVLLALGFMGPEKDGMLAKLGMELDQRGNVKADANKMTSIEGVFTGGDMTRGQSLIVWAIAEGRATARGIDRWLMGTPELP
ncbi:MAG: FAD-dependent oxidoreductase, partial [bacterium]